MRILNQILILFLLLFFCNKSYATHLLGGEITWQCLKTGANTGKYIFTLKVYRDCNSTVTVGATDITYYNGTTGAQIGTIPVNLLAVNDISPKCYNPALQVSCTNPAGNPAAVEENIYVSAPVTISGVPPAGGYVFNWSSCCRSTNITNITNPDSYGFSLRAIMYPYNGLNANPCYDSSPDFAEKPSTSLPTGYQFTFNNNANDAEFDSLAYAWAQPLDEPSFNWPPAAVPFAPSYSVNAQLPDNNENPSNIAPTINQDFGEVSFKSLTSGVFATVLKVTAFKCGVKVAEIFRDIQVSLSNGLAGNNVPVVQAPFPDEFGNYTQFIDTVYAGQSVSFAISATDNDVGTSTSQDIFTEASGIQFGTGFSSTTGGCLISPCATLTPTPNSSSGQPFASLTFFNWQTTCDHLKYGSPCKESNTYKFVIKTRDNICPVPAIQYSTILIVVLPPPPVEPPDLRCASVNADGSVTLNWQPSIDTANIFNSYQIYSSTSPTGPFNVVDSIFNINANSYTDISANAQNGSVYYYIKTRYGCRGNTYSDPSETLQSLYVTATLNGTNADLNWNNLHNPKLSTTSSDYRVYRESPPGTWTLLGTTAANSYSEPALATCTDTIRYRVEIDDSLTCTSVSNYAFLNSNTPIQAPELRCLAVNANGSVDLTWMNPVNTSGIFSEYVTYSSSNINGPYTAFDSVNVYANTSNSDAVSNANTAPVFYYVKSKSNCTVQTQSVPSDTLSTIFLTVNRTGTNVVLNWNALRTPSLTSASNQYRIYKKNPGSTNWMLVTTINNALTMSETSIQGCNDTVFYKIETDDNLTCTSVSNIAYYITDTDIPPPQIRCISVNLNGTINLTWTDTANSQNVFAGYYLYSATNANGPFTLVDSVMNYTTNSYLYNVLNGHTQKYWFYMRIRSNCGNGGLSVNGDTLSSIILNVVNNGGTAQLSWNSLCSPNIPSNSGLFTVYREYPKGNWTTIGTTSNLSFTDNFTVCADSIYYRVEIDDNLPCTSVSSIDGAFFQDLVPPAVPVLDSVSVNPFTGLTVIGWTPSTSGDTKGYIVYNYNGTNYVQIDTVWGINNTNYIYLNSNPSASSEQYTISAIDSCGNTSDFDINIQKTIFLNAGLNICDGDIELQWNNYINWNPGVALYKIYASRDGGPFEQVGVTQSTETTFVHEDVVKGADYCYLITTVNLDGTRTSTSNLYCITATVPNQPDYAYNIYATVLSDTKTEISALTNSSADIAGFRVYRATDDTAWASFNSIITINTVGNNFMQFIDDDVTTQTSSFSYKVIVLDSCGAASVVSNISKTILLDVKANIDVTHELSWTPYTMWMGGVERYNIYRIINEAPDTVFLGSVSGDIHAYVDKAGNKLEGVGKFCYMVQAIEGSGDSLGFKAYSNSNWRCINQESTVYIPNAFNPSDIFNPTFKPVITFADKDGYTFEVYNRWGQKVFGTNDITASWNGKIGNDNAPRDIYAYRLVFKTNTGELVKRNGTVSLIR